MSKSLTLRYIINLAGDLQRRAGENARAVEQASRRQNTALAATDRAAKQADQALQKVGTKTGAARAEADARRIQGAMSGVSAAAQRADSALGRIGAGRTSLERTYNFLGGIARRLDEARRGAERLAHLTARMGQAGAAVAGGAVAGGAAAVATLKRPVSFDDRLANMANVAYADRAPAGRLLGMKDLEDKINEAVRYGGGNRDTAAEALDSMIASGAFKINEAMSLLPDLQKTATAGNAEITDLAQIAVRAKQSYGIAIEDIPKALSKALVAGQEGSFELNNMARWLPKQMAASAGQLGMKGMKDFEQLLATNQASAITAGSKDEAGNNLTNLLLKINSSDTAKDFAKLGIDLPKSLARAKGRGVSGLDAIVDFVDQVASKDKNYTALRAKAGTQEGAAKDTSEAMATILQGSAIGQVFQDRETLMALIGVMQNRKYLAGIQEKTATENVGAVESNYEVRSSRADSKARQVANEADIARSRVFEEIEGPMKSLLDSVTGLAREFPTLTTAVTGAAQALGVAGAAGAGTLVAGLLLRRGGGRSAGAAGGALGGLGGAPIPVYVVNKMPGWDVPTPGGPNAGGGAGRAGTAGGAAAAGAASRASRVLRGAGLLGAGVAAYDVGSTLLDPNLNAVQKTNAVGRTAAGVAGGWAGAQAGAALGALGGPLAPFTVPVGGIAGGLAGYFGAQWLGDSLTDLFSTPTQRAGSTRRADGVRVPLPPEAQNQLGMTLRTPPAYLTNPALQPGPALAAMAKAEPQKVEIGQGQLAVNVSVTDDRTHVSTDVTRQPSALRIDAGYTNPGGFW